MGCVILLVFLGNRSNSSTNGSDLVTFQEDGSLVVMDTKGTITDLVKQGTPRQSVEIDGQNCNVSYGFNSAGKKTILLAVPTGAPAPVVFNLGENQVTIPPKSALRITLGTGDRIEKMDGNPAETVRFAPRTNPAAVVIEDVSSPPPPTQSTPAPTPIQESSWAMTSPDLPPPAPAADPLATSNSSLPDEWPGKLLQPPLLSSQMEEDKFYVRTEFGPRFMSAMNIVSVSGPGETPVLNYGNLDQKKIAFSTGYRQDLDIGVWLTDWFGLALETGFALNAVRGNTQGMTVSSTTFWTVPLLAQLCFQYPNESGWIPYINFGFGGGWTVFKVGGIDYTQPGGDSIPASLSGTGNSVNNAYQIAAGVRYRLYDELSFSLAYKFYGNSEAQMNLDNGVQIRLGSPVTQSAEVGLNFSF